jgi:hypothetical protein
VDNRGFIFFDNFTRQLGRLVEEYGEADFLLKSEKAEAVNVVTQQYFIQFYEHFHPDERGKAISLADYARDLIIDAKAHKHRLNRVLKNPPKKFLALLLHKECYAFDGDPAYYIGLERIDTERKALDWSFHLNEKTWLNREAWISTLERMFGRKPI